MQILYGFCGAIHTDCFVWNERGGELSSVFWAVMLKYQDLLFLDLPTVFLFSFAALFFGGGNLGYWVKRKNRIVMKIDTINGNLSETYHVWETWKINRSRDRFCPERFAQIYFGLHSTLSLPGVMILHTTLKLGFHYFVTYDVYFFRCFSFYFYFQTSKYQNQSKKEYFIPKLECTPQ